MSGCDDADDDDDVSIVFTVRTWARQTLTTEDDLDTEDLKDDERERCHGVLAGVMSCHWCW